MNKILKSFLLVFCIIILIFIYYLYQYFTYSLDNVSKLLNSSNLSDEISIIKSSRSIDYIETVEYYRKNDVTYISQITEPYTTGVDKIDILSIYKDKSEIMISNINKTILKSNNLENFTLNPLYKNNFFNSVQLHGSNENIGNYKYCGKEKINGKSCIKISMTSFYNDYVSVEYYYIDLDTNCIIKFLLYNGKELKDIQEVLQVDIVYNYESINEECLQKFNLDNYLDYTYNEF